MCIQFSFSGMIFSVKPFLYYYFFFLFSFDISKCLLRLQKGHCTSGIMNIFLVWLRRTLIKFCQLCLAVCTKSPKNTGIRKCLLCWWCYSCVCAFFSFDLTHETYTDLELIPRLTSQCCSIVYLIYMQLIIKFLVSI